MKKITLCLMLILALILVPGAIFAAEETAEVDTYQELVTALADSSKTTIKLVGGFELDSTVAVTRSVTIVGDYEITTKSSVKKSFVIENATNAYINVKFKDVTITNATSEGRCIDTRNDYINLTLDGVKLNTTSPSNNQALTLGGEETTGNLKVEMINSSATSAGKAGYGIITFVPGELSIKNSSVTGYAALYIKKGSAGLKVDVIDSTLEGRNDHPKYNSKGEDAGNEFATIFIEETEDIEININNKSKVISSGDGTATQYIAYDYSTGSKGNKINISSATIDAKGPFACVENTNTEIAVGVGVTSNVDVKEYLPEDVAIEYDETTGEFKIVERTIKVEGLENVENAKEAEQILLDSVDKYFVDNPEEAEKYKNTNMIIEVEVFELTSEFVGTMPLKLWETFVDTLKGKDQNATMTKRFVDIYCYASDAGMGMGMGFDLTKLVKPLTFEIKLPENLPNIAEGYERVFYTVRQHANFADNGDVTFEYSVIDAKLTEDGKALQMSTDQFSLFGIGYSDVEKPVVTPPAGEGTEGEIEQQPEVKPEDKPATGGSGTGVVEPEEKPVVDTEKTETPDVPQTGDNVVIYAVFAVVAMAGMVVAIKMKRK